MVKTPAVIDSSASEYIHMNYFPISGLLTPALRQANVAKVHA